MVGWIAVCRKSVHTLFMYLSMIEVVKLSALKRVLVSVSRSTSSRFRADKSSASFRSNLKFKNNLIIKTESRIMFKFRNEVPRKRKKTKLRILTAGGAAIFKIYSLSFFRCLWIDGLTRLENLTLLSFGCINLLLQSKRKCISLIDWYYFSFLL